MAKDPALNIYELSRDWFDFCFANPELVKPNHTALYFFTIEHCNRLGWKKKFGLPTSMAKDAIGIKSYTTYAKTLFDIIEWGFILMVEKSTNQYSSNVVALVKNVKAHGKALDKAMIEHASKHVVKQRDSTCESIGESTVSIDKQYTNTQNTNTQSTTPAKKFDLIFPFGSEEFLKLWHVWREARAAAKKPYHTFTHEQAALEDLQKRSGNNEQTAILIIKHTLSKNAINFIPLNDGKQTRTNSPHSDVAELGRESLADLIRFENRNNAPGG